MSGKCRTCGAFIFWCVTATGKKMPLDARPSPDGTMFAITQARLRGDGSLRDTEDEPMMAVDYRNTGAVAQQHRDAGAPRFTSHFATCPQAAQHRKPKDVQQSLGLSSTDLKERGSDDSV